MATSLSSVETARVELLAASERGEGGARALEIFSGCVDSLLQRLWDEAPAAASAGVLVALGGYGRRQLCLYSDIDILLLFDGTIGPAEEARVRAVLHPALGSAVLGRPSGARGGRVHRARDRQPEVPAGAARRAGGRRRRGAARSSLRAASGPRGARRASSTRLTHLIDERHARFNDTFYQLEPDVKDAPGALRDLLAARTIAAPDRSGAARPRSGGSARARRGGGVPAASAVRSCTSRTSATATMLLHELQEQAAAVLGYGGGRRASRSSA